ncbi:hypothetical protein BH11PLA2_BH11PLA2_25840 [soil metagenome]
MKIPPTDQQRLAIGHEGSVVLSAGAGSGKTSVLVQRYLRHLDTLDVGSLVAITFTDRAAREMRQRIRDAVDDKLQSLEPDSADHQRWLTHRQNLETAAIDTIHGFCTRLLRRFAAAAMIDPAFQVLEHLLTGTVRDEAIESELQQLLLGTGEVSDDLKELMVLFGWAEVSRAVEGFLYDPDPAAWTAFVKKTPAEIAADWVAVANATLNAEYVSLLLSRQPKLEELEHIKPATPEGSAILDAVRMQLHLLRTEPHNVDLAALNEQAKVGNAPRAKKLYGPDNYESVKELYSLIRDKVCKQLEGVTSIPPNLDRAAVVSQRMTRLALAVHTAYAAKKTTAAVADFHDLLTLTRNLLRDNAHVREQLQEQYRVLMLDELQDTDPLQMEIVNLLTGDAKWQGKLFAVGDAKQSIYRFRGADVELFRQLRQEAPPQSRKDLTANFRSVPGILRFVNVLCRKWFPDEALLEPFKAESQEPCVEFLWSLPEKEIRKESIESIRSREAAAIAKRILELTGGPTPQVQRHEIVLLFRAMSNVAIYEAALQDAGIDYYLVGGRAFFAQQEVYDLSNLLNALENPLDSLSVVGTLRSPFFGLSDEAVHAMASHKDGVWAGLHDEANWKAVPAEQRENTARALRNLTAWRSVKDSQPIARLLQRVIADSGYDAALMFEPLGDRKLANLWKLREIAREFDRNKYLLADFVARLADLVERQPQEEQAATLPEEAAHVVRIMSIHQAKGLEFPVVIVPDLSRQSGSGASPVARWHRDLQSALAKVPADVPDEDAANGEPYPNWPETLSKKADEVADASEGRRVFYVACTRAESLLILSSGVKAGPPVEPEGPWMFDLSEVYDLNTGECIGDGEKAVVRYA